VFYSVRKQCVFYSVRKLRNFIDVQKASYGNNIFLSVGRDSSVGIATRYRLDGPGIVSRWGTRYFARVQTGPGAHPASYKMGTGSFPGVKRPGRNVDHLPHLNPRLKKK
jgi:hypothetical protein